MSIGKIKIFSCGVNRDFITSGILKEILGSGSLIGADRLISMFPEYSGETIDIGLGLNAVENKINEIIGCRKSCVVLASGDSLFHGIASWVIERFKDVDIEICPNITAFQYLFSKLKISWKDVQLFSLHKGGDLPWRRILNSSPAMIYCSNALNPAKIASILIEKFPYSGECRTVIGENLGMDNETITESTLAKCAEMKTGGLSVLLLLPPKEGQAIVSPGLALGLPDEEFEHHGGLITHPEVRAIALSKLRLGPGIMWDIGAGSGSVGIEASLLLPSIKIYSVEAAPERYDHIVSNIKSFGSSNVVPVNGNALEKMPDLPAPRSVFIGGGGKDVVDILNYSFERLVSGGRIAAVGVTLETKAALVDALKGNCNEVVSINVSRSKSLGKSRMMKSENSIDIYVYEKKPVNDENKKI